MLEHNLILQLALALLSTTVFLIILEAWGHLTNLLVNFLLGSFKIPEKVVLAPLVPRIFIGGVSYTLFFLAIGSMGLLSKTTVISASLLIVFIAAALGKRWLLLKPANLRLVYADNAYVLWGGLLFFFVTLLLWFRPTTNFDALWYHLTIPKLFVENHSIATQGVLVRYSLQPTLDYFWNLWPLSLPISTAIASILVNAAQAAILSLGLVFASQTGKQVLRWSKSHQLVVPILLGCSYTLLVQLGTGGNDITGFTYGLVTCLYIFSIFVKPRIEWQEFIFATLLVVGLATIKIFFSIFAFLVLLYLLFGAWDRLPAKRRLLKLGLALLIIFVVTYLPWMIRSYSATGRLLDPIGTPGLNQEVYINEGGGTALIHWTTFIFTRFYVSVWPMLTFVYSPLVIAGVLSMYSKSLRKQITNLWLVAFIGLWLVFFASISLQWRYYLPAIGVLLFLGLAWLIKITRDFDAFGRFAILCGLLLLSATSIVRVVYTPLNSSNDPTINHRIYALQFSGTDEYLNTKLRGSLNNYIQISSPQGLTARDRILVANIYYKDTLVYGIHNLAYLKNPILETSINRHDFENVHTLHQFVGLLQTKNIKYVVSRYNINDFCRTISIQDHQECSHHFKHVLHDNTWKVDWYRLTD